MGVAAAAEFRTRQTTEDLEKSALAATLAAIHAVNDSQVLSEQDVAGVAPGDCAHAFEQTRFPLRLYL